MDCIRPGARPLQAFLEYTVSMTDQVSGYIVVLKGDMREDDAEAVLTALRMTKGVIKVTEITDDVAVEIAEARRDREWQDAIWRIYKEGPEVVNE